VASGHKERKMSELYNLEQGVRQEIRQWAEDNPDNNDIDYDGSLHEIVDGSIPVYDSDILELATENLELATDEPELGPAFDGSPTPINIIAANIYEYLSNIAWEEWRLIEEERAED